MSDEPSGYELQRSIEKIAVDLNRGLSDIQSSLVGLVTVREYHAETKRIDGRLDTFASELRREEAARGAAEESFDRRMERLTGFLKWLAASMLLPVALFVATLYVQKG